MKNIFGILAIAVTIAIGLACSGFDDTAKANAIVDEANKFVKTANDSVEKAEKLGTEFDKRVSAMKTEDDLAKTRDFAKDLIKEYESMIDNFKKSGDKFDEASKLKLKDKHKEYLEIKAKEMKLRSDYSVELKKIPQSLIDSSNKAEFTSAVAKVVEKVRSMTSEAKDLGEKAEKIIKDNPDIMAQPKQ